MIPSLRALEDGNTRNRHELSGRVSDIIGLTEAQRSIVLNSGQPMYANRMGWALSQLTRVGALSRPTRGNYKLTDAGREVLARYPTGITEKQLDFLGTDPTSAIRPYVPVARDSQNRSDGPQHDMLDPAEQIEQGVARVHEAVAKELLERLREGAPAFFEQAVVDLLVAMGYGGTGGVGAVTQMVNDGGIDGIIDQDVLGLNKVYVQAKRYAEGNSVGRPELQGFVGALIGKADRGVFITSSSFSRGAIEYADRNTTMRLILIDGERLANLMIRFGVGVQVRDTFHVVEIDEDFFE